MKPKERYEFVENQDYVRFTENSVKPKERYEFVENKDYTSFPNFRKRGVGGTTLWKIKTLWRIKTLLSFTKK